MVQKELEKAYQLKKNTQISLQDLIWLPMKLQEIRWHILTLFGRI
jgi:hypothetical protein